MKKSFLDSLVGLAIKEARRRVTKSGLNICEVEHGTSDLPLGKANHVVLTIKDKFVEEATAGIETEIEHN